MLKITQLQNMSGQHTHYIPGHPHSSIFNIRVLENTVALRPAFCWFPNSTGHSCCAYCCQQENGTSKIHTCPSIPECGYSQGGSWSMFLSWWPHPAFQYSMSFWAWHDISFTLSLVSKMDSIYSLIQNISKISLGQKNRWHSLYLLLTFKNQRMTLHLLQAS